MCNVIDWVDLSIFNGYIYISDVNFPLRIKNIGQSNYLCMYLKCEDNLNKYITVYICIYTVLYVYLEMNGVYLVFQTSQ